MPEFTDDQIKYMTNRFLTWKLPDDFAPDGGIDFEAVGNKNTEHEFNREPLGTNLLDYTQAMQMVRYLVEDLPTD